MSVNNDKLQRAVARVQGAGGITGTGFFIGNNGTLLTCFHVVRDNQTRDLTKQPLTVTFDSAIYQARCIYPSPDPENLDVAVLLLDTGKLPQGAVVLPLGKWSDESGQSRSFDTVGFRSPDKFEWLRSSGAIRGRILTKDKKELLQLASERIGAEEIRQGMSGAPVYHLATEQIVGMIISRYREERIIGGQQTETIEVIPLAIPIELLADIPGVKERLWEQNLLQKLSSILHLAWFTEQAFESFYKSLPLPKLKKYEELGQDKTKALLEQLKGEQIYDLINWVRIKRPDIELDKKVELPPVHRINFVNREDERKEACCSYAPPYILFDAPAGYGKTELLKAIEQRYFRDGWFCIYVQIKTVGISAIDLAYKIAKRVDDETSLLFNQIEVVGKILAGNLKKKIK